MTSFPLNRELLIAARRVLFPRRRLTWVVGGAASGKSTLCRALSLAWSIPVYDMDEHLYGEYTRLSSIRRHPALSEWFRASDSFAWLLGLTEAAFTAFNRASTAEILDLLAADISGMDGDAPLMVDGGITNPALLAQVMPTSRIVCVATSPALSREVWEGDERRWMKAMALALPDGEAAWQRFLRFDELMGETIVTECRDNQIPVVVREENSSVQELADQAACYLGIASSS